jgi:two-component system sensor histidine kinase BaeS
MRSLALKLTLAFLLVGLTGAFLVAFFVRRHTQSQFDQLVRTQNQQALVSLLTGYYQENGGWAGVESVFRPAPNVPPQQPDSRARLDVRRNLFSIASPDGTIVFGGGRERPGQHVRPADLKNGVALVVDDNTVGYLLFNPALDSWNPDTPEGNFLINVTQATIYSAIGAVLVALVLGGILAYTLTRSLRELTHATEILAKGELGHQVKIRSKDELGHLAASFNKMSSELARSNELRRQMTANTAHDLRTPLSVIMGYTEALDDGKLKPSPEIFSMLHTEALHLNHMIDDLKTLSLADAGELPLNPQAVDPATLLNRIAIAQQIKAENKGITIKVNLATALPQINVDVERMNQVLGNLVENALRYTLEGGEVLLSAESKPDVIRLQVADNGTGIAAEDLPNIFERSFRGDVARVQQNGESGLGLAISKSLVEAQGGTISAESSPGVGTTFTITFPIIK